MWRRGLGGENSKGQSGMGPIYVVDREDDFEAFAKWLFHVKSVCYLDFDSRF